MWESKAIYFGAGSVVALLCVGTCNVVRGQLACGKHGREAIAISTLSTSLRCSEVAKPEPVVTSPSTSTPLTDLERP